MPIRSGFQILNLIPVSPYWQRRYKINQNFDSRWFNYQRNIHTINGPISKWKFYQSSIKQHWALFILVLYYIIISNSHFPPFVFFQSSIFSLDYWETFPIYIIPLLRKYLLLQLENLSKSFEFNWCYKHRYYNSNHKSFVN